MKYVVFLGDGMSDIAIPELSGQTPLEAAFHPAMDELAQKGIFGMAKTIPDGMEAGSDTANLSVFGYDPKIYYSGRSPLEAVNMGIELSPGDITYRCNTVTLSQAEKLEDAVMLDFSAGEIENKDSHAVIQSVAEHFSDRVELYAGIRYRHCLVLRNAETGAKTSAPHDIHGQIVGQYLPKEKNSDLLREIMEYSYRELPKHPVNIRRIKEGKKPVSALWLWGEGRKPQMTDFKEKFGVKGSIISAVDLIQGMGKCAGLRVLHVPGATGDWHTDYAAKGRAAIDALKEDDFVYIHVEAPDECGHHGNAAEKVKSIEQIDEKIVAPVIEYLKSCGEPFGALLMPDHPTLVSTTTHSPEPVPFALYDSRRPFDNGSDIRFTEPFAQSTGLYKEHAHELMNLMINFEEIAALSHRKYAF
ncbi:MAG TPA: cofactor-independent phosphoglycerate mutase [Oscillospiraceae bacterium]|nr:cofactor-independent phosphoglycerate mutase [Oscillospiraceae bacterium]HPF55745.1 cofactor-independent phosphoglycerate mutase [Clostridiales bacterium]HPK34258.1 cofactor-independent phosphoglycerate mutase [Oscillospiraceae bacterium]HPR74839.1 cofactor-independent phosphoglycerate mutase [Oscillospiraceae bacterium]